MRKIHPLVWFMLFLWISVLISVAIAINHVKDVPPEPVILHFETRHELYHINGQYRVLIRINGEYRGSLMMSRTELSLPHQINTDYLVDLDIAERRK